MYGWQNEMFWLGEKIFWSWLCLFLAHISIPRGVILTIINSWKHIPISPSIHTHLTPSFQQHQSTNDHSNCPNLMILWILSITHRDNYKVSIIIDSNHSLICTPIFWSSIHGFLIEDAQSPSTPKPIDRQSVLNAKSIVIYTEGYGNIRQVQPKIDVVRFRFRWIYSQRWFNKVSFLQCGFFTFTFAFQ